MLLNSWKIYDPKEGDDDGLGTFYNGEGILEDLFSTYNYYKSPMLNQWYFNKERDNPFAFLCYNPFPFFNFISAYNQRVIKIRLFAGQNTQTGQGTTEKAGSTAEEGDNEMDVDYTMDEPDEDTIVREELQIADDSLPEVSPSAILARDIIRVNGWHRNDDALDEEDETDVHETLQAIRGTLLMDYIKEATLKQEKDHQKLLAAIRKAEEAELEGNNINSSSDIETNLNVESSNCDTSEDDERPLSHYL